MGNRKVSYYQGMRYQGGGPMLAWILHSLSGLGILTFVGLHVIASFFMQQLGSDWATFVNTIYESWVFQIVAVFVVLFHAIGGLRIAILDLWPRFLVFQRESIWLQWLIFLPIYGLTIFILIQHALAGG